MKVLFLDTNVYLHCRSVEDIDWPKLVGAATVEIVVPRVILRELDKQKNSNASPKLRDRARSILKKLDAWLVNEGQEIRPGVKVRLYTVVPNQQQIESCGLKPEWEDDVFLATVWYFKLASTNQDTLVVTQDVGPRLNAKNLNLAALQLPDEYRLPPEPDPLERENRELQRRIKMLENAAPKLDIRLVTDDGLADRKTWRLPDPPLYPAEQNKHILESLRTKFTKKILPVAKNLSPMQAIIDNLNLAGLQDFEGYNKECEEYFKRYEAYLKEMWERQKAVKRLVPLRFMLVNSGTKPGEDIDCYFHFPDGFDLYKADDFDRLMAEPCKPEPPQPPGTVRGIDFNALSSSINAIHNSSIRIPAPPGNVSGLSIRRSRSYDVRVHIQRIKHGDKLLVASLCAQFDSYKTATSFGVDYRIRAANVPEEIQDKIHVIIEKSGEP